MKIAILQRVLPDFRYDLFKKLSEEENIELRVFFGEGAKKGASKNTLRDYSAFAKKIYSFIFIKSKVRLIQPFLIFHLIKFNPDVLVSEPATYFPNNLVAFLYAKLFRKKFVWWEIGINKEMPLLRKMIEPFIKIMIKNSNAYLAYSTQGKSYLIKNYNINPNMIFIAYNTIYNEPCVDIEEEKKTKNDLCIKRNEKVIAYIGALEKRKKLEIIFDSFKDVSAKVPSHLLIIGDGIDEVYYKNYSKGIRNVHFLGHKQIYEANKYLLVSDYTVLPSQGGLAINHSLSCGTPVICGVNDGTEKDLIKENLTGVIIDEINSTKLTKELLRDTSYNRDVIREFYFSNYSIHDMITQIKKASSC